MEEVEFFGIVFRSADHMYWFIFTMIVLGVSILLAVGCLLAKVYIGPAIMWGLLGSVFLMISFTAVSETKQGTVNGPVWSVDCIWYNSLLGRIYLSAAALSLIFHYIYKRWKRKSL